MVHGRSSSMPLSATNCNRAPDAPIAPETPAQKKLDAGMENVADLRLHNKLDALWPKAAAMAAGAASPKASEPATTGAKQRASLK